MLFSYNTELLLIELAVSPRPFSGCRDGASASGVCLCGDLADFFREKSIAHRSMHLLKFVLISVSSIAVVSIYQKKPARIDAGAENMRMKAGRHEMVMITDSKKRAQDTGVPLDVGKWGSRDILSEGDGWNDEGRLTEEDSFSYNR